MSSWHDREYPPDCSGRTKTFRPRERYELAPVPPANYDVSPDGQRFLMLKSTEQTQPAPTQINVRLIGESSRKDDQLDARTLARLARIDPGLLGAVRHRSAKAQIHLTVTRARAALVSTRTALVNAARGLTKSYGERLKKCGTEQMNREICKGLSQELRDALDPLLGEIESLSERIREYDRRIEQIAKEVHPEVALLKQVKGVGALIALTYVLTLDDPHRFRRSRAAGGFFGW